MAERMHLFALLTMMAVIDSLTSFVHIKRTCKGEAFSQNSDTAQA